MWFLKSRMSGKGICVLVVTDRNKVGVTYCECDNWRVFGPVHILLLGSSPTIGTICACLCCTGWELFLLIEGERILLLSLAHFFACSCLFLPVIVCEAVSFLCLCQPKQCFHFWSQSAPLFFYMYSDFLVSFFPEHCFSDVRVGPEVVTDPAFLVTRLAKEANFSLSRSRGHFVYTFLWKLFLFFKKNVAFFCNER